MHTQRLIYSWAIIGAVVSVFLVGCHRSSPSDLLHTGARGELDSGVWIQERALEVHASPQVVLALLPHYGLPFNPGLIASQQPISAGQERDIQAILLGLESVDFIYLTYYRQHQLADYYAEQLMATGEAMGLTTVLRLHTLDSIRRAWEFLGEILPPLNGRLVETNAYLKAQPDQGAYFLVAAASWLECTYILAMLAQAQEDKRLRLLVAEQGFMLRHLQNQLAGMVYESPVSSRFFTSLTEVQKAYAGIHIHYYYGASETVNAAHLTRIQSRMQVSMSKHQLKAIAQSLAKAKQEFYGPIEGL